MVSAQMEVDIEIWLKPIVEQLGYQFKQKGLETCPQQFALTSLRDHMRNGCNNLAMGGVRPTDHLVSQDTTILATTIQECE